MTTPLVEGDVVVIRQLIASKREVDGTEGATRQPRVGDQGAIVHVIGPDRRLVECIDSSGMTAWLATFHIDELSPTPVGWSFRVMETSSGVFRAVGAGPRGMIVESTDTDADKVLADCRQFALRYSA